MITVRSTINLAHQSVPNIIPVVQGDTGRAILFTLADFTIPTGATARYFITKPSGLAVYNDATIDGNTVLVDLTAQSLAEYGDCPGQVRIILGDDIVTSFEFILHVDPFRGIDAVESTTETNIFDKAVEDAREAIAEAAEDAEEYISQALDTTLTIPDKAADAKATGDAISDSADAVIAQMRAEIANVYPTETAQGNPATFTDGAESIPVKDLKVNIVPTQDLHGYDKPWAGGAGKNLLPLTTDAIKTASEKTWTGDSVVENRVTYAIVKDSAGNVIGLTANGTPTNDYSQLIIAKTNVSPGVYTFSGITGGGSQTYYLRNVVRDANGTAIAIDGGVFVDVYTAPVTKTLPSNASYVNTYMGIAPGYTANSVVYRPMISTSSDATFEPYSNECPITGVDSVEVARTGINQWDEEWENGLWNADGVKTTDPNAIRCKNPILVVPGTTYYTVVPTGNTIIIREMDADQNVIKTNVVGNGMLTVDSKTHYIVLCTFSSAGITTYGHDISINYPSTDHDYHAGQVQELSIPLDRTVYGGTLDVTTGVLTVDRVAKALTTARNLSGTYAGSIIYNSGSPETADADFSKPIMCNRLEYVGSSTSNFRYGTCINAQLYSFNLWIKDGAFANLTEASEWLANNETQIAYYLATPLTYTLTPQELLSVLGTNHISTDAESVEVEYRADIQLYIEQLTKPNEDDLIANQAIAAGTFFMIGNRLFLSTASIANGAAITPGTNATELSLSEALNTLNA